MRSCKMLLAMIGAISLLGVLAAAASAGRLSTSSQTWRATFSALRFNAVFGSITCQVSLEGSLHSRVITKTAASLIGYVTRADLGTCAEGRFTILRETLPWHVRYASFTGTLPNITQIGLTIVGWSERMQEPLAGCLFRSTAESPVNLTLTRNTTTGALTGTTLSGTIPTSCGINGTFSSSGGTSTVTVLNGAAAITVTLI